MPYTPLCFAEIQQQQVISSPQIPVKSGKLPQGEIFQVLEGSSFLAL